jgi:mannose-6-phosphate isomerase
MILDQRQVSVVDQQIIYPLTFQPVFRDYIWGGRNLETFFGRQLPPGIVAESWEISGHASSPTMVDRGYWNGCTLSDVLAALGVDLVGRNGAATLARGRFPLLVKLLDANQDLSVQVHPDDAFAGMHEHGELGKTEMWYVLRARPGAELIFGLERGATPASLRKAIDDHAVEKELHRLPVQAGDAVFIPSGTVHALLAGIVVAEIQQNSDTTYRLHDWGRLGADGKPRPLHIDKALRVIDWARAEPAKVEPRFVRTLDGLQQSELVRCSYFVVERVTLDAGVRFRGVCDGATSEIWGCISGAIDLEWTGQPLPMQAIRFVLLPAILGPFSVRARQSSVLLRAFIPG